MDWKKYWDTNASFNADNEISQVQRKDIESTLLTVNRILKILEITRVDDVLDLCCGNGIITQQISKKSNRIVGVDHSKVLIDVALKKHNELNISYIVGDCLKLSDIIDNQKFNKAYLQFSFQYFDKKRKGEQVIREMVKCLKPNSKIFIGDIPNQDKFDAFYNTPIKKARFYKDRLLNKNQMGKFWEVAELDAICKKLEVKGTYIEQSKQLPYSHYRFDYLIEN